MDLVGINLQTTGKTSKAVSTEEQTYPLNSVLQFYK